MDVQAAGEPLLFPIKTNRPDPEDLADFPGFHPGDDTGRPPLSARKSLT